MSIVPLTRDDGTVNGQGGDLAFVRVLGPVQVVTASGRSLDLPSASQRRLVALLASEVHPVPSRGLDWICDVLAVSPSALRTTVSRVRRAVGDGAIAGAQGRYQLAVPVDAALFTSALSEVSLNRLLPSLALSFSGEIRPPLCHRQPQVPVWLVSFGTPSALRLLGTTFL